MKLNSWLFPELAISCCFYLIQCKLVQEHGINNEEVETDPAVIKKKRINNLFDASHPLPLINNIDEKPLARSTARAVMW